MPSGHVIKRVLKTSYSKTISDVDGSTSGEENRLLEALTPHIRLACRCSSGRNGLQLCCLFVRLSRPSYSTTQILGPKKMIDISMDFGLLGAQT